jgi:Icc-related predicted phosphoesterase
VLRIALARQFLPEMAKTRIYFVSDLHGSSVCFRKFVNAAKIYEAQVMILGGDVAGKAIQSIVRAPGGHWQCRFIGTNYDVVEGSELIALEKLIADHGYYAYRADPGELEAREAADGLDDLFLQLMRERLTEWLELADARLRPLGTPLYYMLGNDDPEELGALLDSAPWGTHAEGKVVWLDDEHEMISCGYSNVTPWHTYREQDETHLLTVQASLGQVQMAAVGSTAVRDAEQTYQPLLGLHGHIHESSGIRRIGRTVVLNPGSDYSTGALNGALITLDGDKVKAQQLVRG